MLAELTLTGPRARLAAFHQTAAQAAQARLDELDEDSHASRLVQDRILSLLRCTTWSGTEAAATLTLITEGDRDAVESAVAALAGLANQDGIPAWTWWEIEEDD